MERLRTTLFVLVIGGFIQNVKCHTSSAIPDIIKNCYNRNFTITARPPTTLPLLVELIRKIELDERNSVTARVLVTSMLHGVIFNGIRRTRSINDNHNVLPYRATGEEFYRYLVLVDYLIPGQIQLFPVDSLTQSELCCLHSIVSRTVDPLERGDETSSCNDRSSMPIEVYDNLSRSSCPWKKGVIKTKWGPISSSQILSALAAGMQRNEVTFGHLTELLEEENNLTHQSLPSQTNVDTVWVSTLAGDMAATILNQTTDNPVVGVGGFWNDTLFPRAFYLKSHTWDMTQADILSGIDGIILGTYVSDWLKTLDTIRLSQILDMYYSERGVPFGVGYKAGKRSQVLEELWKNVNLEEQIIGSVKLLEGVGGSEATLIDFGIRELARGSAEKLKDIAGRIASDYDKIEYLGEKQMMAPIELIIILDGTFEHYKAMQMIYTLSEAIQVSHYGSKLGIINGQTGRWMVNVTSELFQIFSDLTQLKDEWPALLHLQNGLRSVIAYYNNRTERDCLNRHIKPIGKVITVLSRDGRLTDNDIVSSRRILSSIKSAYPGTRIIYLTQRQDNALQQLITYNDNVLVTSTDVLSVTTKVLEQLVQIPASIVKYFCNESEVVFEDYVTPQVENFYEIHREFIQRYSFNTEFINKNYGNLRICAFKSNEKSTRFCKNLTMSEMVSFSSTDFCTRDAPCDLWFQVTGNNSQIRCTENDCRYPDQIRMDVKYTRSGSCSRMPFSILLLLFQIMLITNL